MLDKILDKLVEKERKANGRESHTTMVIVDSKSIKLHIGVDILGLSHAIKITTANVTDRNGATDMISYYHNHTNNLSRMKKGLALICPTFESLVIFFNTLLYITLYTL